MKFWRALAWGVLAAGIYLVLLATVMLNAVSG